MADISSTPCPLPTYGAGNVLRPESSLKLSVRVPPHVDAAAAAQALKETLEKDPPYGAAGNFRKIPRTSFYLPCSIYISPPLNTVQSPSRRTRLAPAGLHRFSYPGSSRPLTTPLSPSGRSQSATSARADRSYAPRTDICRLLSDQCQPFMGMLGQRYPKYCFAFILTAVS